MINVIKLKKNYLLCLKVFAFVTYEQQKLKYIYFNREIPSLIQGANPTKVAM